MKHLRKYEQFNLDLSRILQSGMQRPGYDLSSISRALNFSEERLLEIAKHPITVPGCDFAKVVTHLGLTNEFYEALFRELRRSLKFDGEGPDLH